MKKVILFLILLFAVACETHKCRYPTTGIMEIGEVMGTVSYYGLDSNDIKELSDTYAFLSSLQFSYMPSYENVMSYLNDLIVKIAPIRSNGEYIFTDVPPGSYYLNIGAFDSPWFHFMSYHSITPFVVIQKGECFEVSNIELNPGCVTSLVWFLDGHDLTKLGFNFGQGMNVSSPESADIWYDGENQMLVAPADNIAKMPSEPEGLCFIFFAPDTGYYNQLFIPLGEGEASSHFVVKTQEGKYAKCRMTGGEFGSSSGGVVWCRTIYFQWMLQPDGSKKFSY
jgi:hypothetical protein